MAKSLVLAVLLSAGLALSACTNPYDPVQRTVGGGLIGAGAGAAIGAAAAGGPGAATGAAIGGAVGALTGAATTPPPPGYGYGPPPAYGYPPPPPRRLAYRRCGYGWHLVRGHWGPYGRWVGPHCVPNA